MKSLDLLYAAPADCEPESVFEATRKLFRVMIEEAVAQPVTYFDTFDWRLHRDGGTLRQTEERQGSTLSWMMFDGRVRHRLSTRKAPGFARDFPAGAFRRALLPVVAMRRLLPVAELKIDHRTLRVLDRRDKTVVRLRLEEAVVVGSRRDAASSRGDIEPTPLAAVWRVLPVRGYDKANRRLIRFLEAELGFTKLESSELERALTAVGRRARDYTSKVQIKLDPGMPAGEAAKTIHRLLLAAIRRNEPGTRQDLDSEFLHDFRVAVRRTRSALSQIKGVFTEQDLSHFKSELAWLGSLTGPTRDLDVYLLKMDAYKADLPSAVSRHLEPLSRHLVAEQRRAQRQMVRRLDSPRYRTLLEAWDRFLGQPADPEAGPNAGRPIVELASERIWKIYRRVLKEGVAIHAETPAEAVHELRIDCKKLRYLMEFFRCLYDGQRIERVIKALKRLQDNLGDFNDYEVQQASLVGFGEDMQRKGAAPPATLMAMGRLVGYLEVGQARERGQVEKRFAEFARVENQRLARSLFR